jgi:hypothetical protein
LIGLGLAACGGEGGAATGDAGASGGDGGSGATPLTCQDFAYCSTYDVHRYVAATGTPSGGAIRDGVYRLAWEVDPPSSNQTPGSSYAEALMFRGGKYFVEKRYRGTIAISGTTLAFTYTGYCDLGKDDGETSVFTNEQQYTAMSDRVILYDAVKSGATSWLRERVFLRVDDVCRTVSSTPSSPGDSYQCTVFNCVCRTAQGSTIQACS